MLAISSQDANFFNLKVFWDRIVEVISKLAGISLQKLSRSYTYV
jgi:hypothetical protein